MMEPGIYHGISHDEYHGMADIVSNSYLGRLDIVPAAAKVERKDTKALTFGKAFHCYTLEGREKFDGEFVVAADIGKRTKLEKEYWDDLRASNQEKTIVEWYDFLMICEMSKSVHTHPLAAKLLDGIVPETSIFWTDNETGLECKARPDGTNQDRRVIIDLKTALSASERAFQAACVRYGYARENAIYAEGYETATGVPFEEIIFPFIVVEKTPPYRCEVYVLDQDFIAWGRNEFHRLLRLERQCRDNNHWPHYRNGGAMALTKPSYVTESEDE